MKKIAVLLICIISIFAFAFSASAKNSIDSIDIKATVMENGDMRVDQIWSGSFDEATEVYYTFDTLDGRLDIVDFTVEMNGESFETLGSWDPYDSFSEKAGKCGLNSVGNDYEVCWGISSYGSNTYNVSYIIKNAVAGYEDTDGFKLGFIGRDYDTRPTDVTISISLWDGRDITHDFCNVWAFGYDGEINFDGNKIVSATDSPLYEDDYVLVMVEFQKGILTPTRSEDEYFSDLKDATLADSDYGYEYDDYFGYYNDPSQYDLNGADIIGIVFLVILLFFVISIVSIPYIRRLKVKSIKKKTDYYREAPLESLNEAYAMLKGCGECDESAIIDARLLKLTMLGHIVPVENKNESLFNPGKTNFIIKERDRSNLDIYDKELLELLIKASGKDGLLEPAEMREYCRSHWTVPHKFLQHCEANGVFLLNQKNYSKIKPLKTSVLGDGFNKTYPEYQNIFKYTPEGIAELQKYFGLEKYLKDFSLVAEKDISDTYIWQNLLIYASLFGIADKVAKELKKMYPQHLPQLEAYERDIIFVTRSRGFMYSAMKTGLSNSNSGGSFGSPGRFSGGGGHVSMGGGFGGGFGGAGRGGTR